MPKRSPAITNPRELSLKAIQEIASQTSQRLALLDTAFDGISGTTDTRRLTQQVGQLQSQVNSLNQQLRLVQQAVAGLSTGTVASETTYVVIEGDTEIEETYIPMS